MKTIKRTVLAVLAALGVAVAVAGPTVAGIPMNHAESLSR